MKIVTVVGARPQFVKASVLSRAIVHFNQKHATQVDEVLIHTGQHFDENMSSCFFEELNITAPKYNLDINQGGHGQMTGRMLEGLENLMQKEAPDVVVVYGDTNSTLAAALSAAKLHIPVAHVEAGLRSWNKRMPEEINRIATDHVSTLLFCPTNVAVENLQRENIRTGVHQVGDIMYDAFLFASGQSDFQSATNDGNIASTLQQPFILATLHRAENTDDKNRLSNALEGLNNVAVSTQVVLPLHPRTKNKIQTYGLSGLTNNITLVEPLAYNQMIALLSRCEKVVTDSGGLQKEAYFAKVPCITLRDETEWLETVDTGWNTLVDVRTQDIAAAITSASSPGNWKPIYGNGETGKQILELLVQQFVQSCAP